MRTAGSVIEPPAAGNGRGDPLPRSEDETGISQAIVPKEFLKENRKLIVGSPGLVVEGILQQRDGTVSVRGEKFWSRKELVRVPSQDFQ